MVAHVGGGRSAAAFPQPDVYSGDGKCLTTGFFSLLRLAPSKLRRKEM